MAKEGSVAPKERINIIYKPATGGAQEEQELPLKLLLLGDYTLQDDETPLEKRDRFKIDKDNFNERMRKQNLNLSFTAADRLSDDPGAEMPVNLHFDTLKDFEPESVANQVPELKKLLELRQALVALKGPLGNTPAFRKALSAILSDETSKEQLLKELGVGEATDE